MQNLAVDAYFVKRWVHAGTELRDNLMIDFDAARENQFLALTPARNARGGEDFLEAVGRLRLIDGIVIACARYGPIAGTDSSRRTPRALLERFAAILATWGHLASDDWTVCEW